jgi:predicted Zn finger-like uncharacterized protein
MLFTRCPECETTFRITEEALQKAGGQVRCGRCNQIFNAYDGLREHVAAAANELSTTGIREESYIENRAAAAGSGSTEHARATEDSDAEARGTIEGDREREEGDGAELRDGGDSDSADQDHRGETIVLDSSDAAAAGGESGAEEPQETETGAGSGISASEIDAVLEQTLAAPAEPAWMLIDTARDISGRRARAWLAAACVAFMLLGGQLVHHFRGQLAGKPVIGPVLQGIYGALGSELAPFWNVQQYDLVDWVAQAEPSDGGQGTLIIRSQLRNIGTKPQPYPHVHLRLLDRYENTVGSRLFSPDEYLSDGTETGAMMAPGETAEAELIIVDPGPDAYGFEIDVCVAIGTNFDCAAAQTFAD